MTVINSAADLQNMNLNLADNYELGGNIDASVIANFVPVGTWGVPFTGTFDGKGSIISGLTINRPLTDDVGMFGAARGASITDVIFTGANVIGRDDTAILCGYAEDTPITDCEINGILEGDLSVGHLVGLYWAKTQNITISNCSAFGTLTSNGDDSGGLIGQPFTTLPFTFSVERCYTDVAITSSNGYAGGILGRTGGLVTVERSYARGSIDLIAAGLANTGGVIGLSSWGAGAITNITNCYARGVLTGAANSEMSGVLGYTGQDCFLNNSYSACPNSATFIYGVAPSWDADVIAFGCYFDNDLIVGVADPDSGGFPASTVLMKTQSTFIGWDFAAIWFIGANYNNGYPALRGMPCFPFFYNGVWINNPTELRNWAVVWGIPEADLWTASLPAPPPIIAPTVTTGGAVVS